LTASVLIVPEKNNEAEGYEEPINVVTDGLSAAGFFPQNANPGDLDAGMERDASNGLTLKDALSGILTLSAVRHAVARANHTNVARASGKVVTVNSFKDAGETILIYEAAITRTLGKVTQVVEKERDEAGVLRRTLTTTVTRTSGKVTDVDTVVT